MRDDIRASRRQRAIERIVANAERVASTKAQKEKAQAIQPTGNVRDAGNRELYLLEGIAEWSDSLVRNSAPSESKASSKKKSEDKEEEE